MGKWSEDPGTTIVAQFEQVALPAKTITYIPDAEDAPAGTSAPPADAGADGGGGGATLPVVTEYSVAPVDEFPKQVEFAGGPAQATVSAPNLVGFFDGKTLMWVKLWDDSVAEFRSWSEIEDKLGQIKGIFEYHPPNPGTVVKYFEVTATLDVADPAGGFVKKTARFGIESRFEHTAGRDKLLQVSAKLEEKLKAYKETLK